MTKKELLARIEELERRVALLEAPNVPATWTIQPTPMPAFGEGWIATTPLRSPYSAYGGGL